MKAITFSEYGQAEVLKLGEVPKPVPKGNEVLVKVRAGSVNAADWRMMSASPFLVRFYSGLFRPKRVTSPGGDVAGVVESTGSDSTENYLMSRQTMKPKLINLLGLPILPLISLFCTEISAEPLAGALWTEPKTGMQFVWMPTGCFEMGGTDDDAKPIHRVCVKGFWMGRYEVTQAQYHLVMGKYPGSVRASNNPVETITFEDAGEFAEEMSRSTGTSVRLPSEAEWEYACRAGGSHNKYCGEGENLDRLAWHDGNSGKSTHAVGRLAVNDWGLYDMNGNVSEWTQDCENPNYSGAPVDGSAWISGDCVERMVRGGSMTMKAEDMTASSRHTGETLIRYTVIGFRVARTSR